MSEASATGAPTRPRRSREQLAALAVALLATLVFLPSVATGFVFDDAQLVTTNEYVHDWRWFPRAFTTHFWDVSRVADAGEVRRYYRPLVTVSYLVVWMAAGARAWAFHLVNVLLHGATAWLATRAAIRWTSSTFWGVTIGVVFAVHPSRTENVTWISGRTDVMMALFVLLALEAFAAFERKRAGSPARAWVSFGAGLAAVIAGVLSKEPAAMIPLLLLADRAVADRAAAGGEPRPSRLPLVVTSVLCVGYLAARALFFPPETDVERSFTPMHALVTVGAYVQRAVVPWPPTMYYHALVGGPSGPVYPTWLVVLGAVVVAAGIAALVLAWRRSRVAFWLLLATAAFMGPLLNVYFTGMNVTAQDRFLYAPLLFGAASVVALFRQPLERIARRPIAPIVVAGVALSWTILVEVRTLDYRNDQTFWESELRYNPTHPFVLQNLARVAAGRGDLATAYEYYRRATLPEARRYLLVDDPGAHFQQAVVLAALLPDGRVEELGLLLDELWRLVDPAKVPARRTLHGFEIGAPLSDFSRVSREKSLHWDIVLLATRLGDVARAERVLRDLPERSVVASGSPLNDALALARLGRFAEARAVHRTLRARSEELAELVPPQELASFAARLDRAEQLAAERDEAPAPEMRVALEALRLAELGAYLAALRVLDTGGALDLPQARPLVLQLLVACRLDEAARARAAQDVGSERADAVVRELAAQLPPRLREMDPVPGDLRDVLARAASRPPP